MNQLLFIYLVTVVIYYILLRKGTIKEVEFAVENGPSAWAAFIIMLIPIVNIIFIILFIDILYFKWMYNMNVKTYKFKRKWWQYILLLPKNN